MAEGRAYVPIADPNSTILSTSGTKSLVAQSSSLCSCGPGLDTPPPPPPPTGCFACKKRRIFCDRRLPACHKCEKKGIKCPGYQKPKIIWKVLKTNQVPESRKESIDKNDVGKPEPLAGAPTRKSSTFQFLCVILNLHVLWDQCNPFHYVD